MPWILASMSSTVGSMPGSTGLSVARHPEWSNPGADDGTGGLVSAVVVRRRRHRRSVTVCVYLIGAYCLGVKNAMGPDDMDGLALRWFIDQVFSGHHAPPEPAPIELVRDLVLGAAEFAHGLGFAPRPGFEHARAHLGPWAAPSAITFGCDGKPTYVEGPYDDSQDVLRTLRRAVGRNGLSLHSRARRRQPTKDRLKARPPLPQIGRAVSSGGGTII
jgi:hypothetical protein